MANMEESLKNINLEIYYDLKKLYWFKKKFLTVDSFDYRNYDTEKKYFDYLKIKQQINKDFILYTKGFFSWIKRIFWFLFWIIALYKLFFVSVLADYLLLIFVLSGYAHIYKTGAWESKSLKISKEGCEIDKTILIAWNEISNFITIPYLMNEESNYIIAVFIVLNNGIIYKLKFNEFSFRSRIKNRFLPIYVEYFRNGFIKRN